MIRQPVQGRVREDEVPRRLVRERGDVSLREAQARTRDRGGTREHVRRALEAERLARAESRVQVRGQLAGAAAEVDDTHARCALDQRHDVVERLSPFAREALVLRGVPGILRHVRIVELRPELRKPRAAQDRRAALGAVIRQRRGPAREAARGRPAAAPAAADPLQGALAAAYTRSPATQVSSTLGGCSGSSAPSSTTRSARRPGTSRPRSCSCPPAYAAPAV